MVDGGARTRLNADYADPFRALPVPFELKLEMIQEFRIVTFLAAMTSAPVIFSPSTIVPSTVILRPDVARSAVPAG